MSICMNEGRHAKGIEQPVHYTEGTSNGSSRNKSVPKL